VQQDVFLFDGSVRDNLAYGRRSATDEEILDAARRANAHEFIVKLPKQYETFIGERGSSSRGPAAAAGHRPGDPGVAPNPHPRRGHEQPGHRKRTVVQASMAELLAGRTTFMIAHRLSTIRRADLILLMEEGRVIERGVTRS